MTPDKKDRLGKIFDIIKQATMTYKQENKLSITSRSENIASRLNPLAEIFPENKDFLT
jgi:hypothetical protein